ncbi:carbohydrate ABC transporter permease [Sediminispirochaeta smaragdinae]|jgi:glucose/mannose transport system permease protein|uniref:Binding-protein-dependent transport systems inner membrane component n=1 Tax=Sediminispirochaeta smaragdinae (strain DSM 11293 / JCM 15392 / SEBR 4228) TaxID=573413 RepID=E1R2D8_SEDSS|nr:sugar ABC transporter permease [Sediminispirochaeta smaragdinae]ADK82498.1 binding-protein-dependent transport systems inner membrane component [Sediminispirochaeta smaragdinae DSM 11293]
MAHSKKLKNRSDMVKAILVLLPSVVLVAVFVYGFIFNTIYVSLTDWGQGAGLAEHPVKHWVGLGNYRQLFSGFIYGRFRQDLVNTFFYSVILLVGTLFLGFLLAVLLDRKIRHEGFYRTIFLYPMALSFIVTGTIWRWLLAPNGGLNLLPTFLGLKKGEFLWISSRKAILTFNWQHLLSILFFIAALVFLMLLLRAVRNRIHRKMVIHSALFASSLLLCAISRWLLPPLLPFEEIHGFNLATLGILLAAIWQYSGYTMALYLAGLRGLPESIRESSRMDGAGEFTYYWKIAIPNIKPITLSAVIILSHISLKMFDLIYAMAGADNANTGHPSVNMYLTTFRANQFAMGAAIAVILFIMAALFVIPYLMHSHKQRRQG